MRTLSLTLFSILAVSSSCSVDESIPLGTDDDATEGDLTSDGATEALLCPQAFAACGGDPTGSWSLVAFCGTQPSPDICASASTSISLVGTETTSFDGESMVTSKMGTYVYTTDASSCLGASSGETCDSIDERTPLQTCAPTVADADDCACSWSVPVSGISTFTYSVSGGVLTYEQEGETDPFASDFCVDGDALTVALPGTSTLVGLYSRQ